MFHHLTHSHASILSCQRAVKLRLFCHARPHECIISKFQNAVDANFVTPNGNALGLPNYYLSVNTKANHREQKAVVVLLLKQSLTLDGTHVPNSLG